MTHFQSTALDTIEIVEGEAYLIGFDPETRQYSWEGINCFEDYCSEDELLSLEAANADAVQYLSTVSVD